MPKFDRAQLLAALLGESVPGVPGAVGGSGNKTGPQKVVPKQGVTGHVPGVPGVPAANEWGPQDWLAYFEERAAVAEHDGRQTRTVAERWAYEACLVEWLTQNAPPPGDASRCLHCGEGGAKLVPMLTGARHHAWLHARCWQSWYAERRAKAAQALAAMGLRP